PSSIMSVAVPGRLAGGRIFPENSSEDTVVLLISQRSQFFLVACTLYAAHPLSFYDYFPLSKPRNHLVLLYLCSKTPIRTGPRIRNHLGQLA
ncbi:hypothetical protein PMAYCL1PPCAC_09949, partial [Pristionchus mayeri]